MSSKAKRKSKSKGYVTRRIRDKEGNIIVKRYKRRESSLGIKIPWPRVPSILLGVIFGLYAYIINLYRNQSLGTLFTPSTAVELQATLDGIVDA